MTALGIGKAVYTILSSDQDLVALLGGSPQIFPLIVDSETNYPFIVYKRLDIQPLDTKDRFICQSTVSVQFVIVSSQYSLGIDIAERLDSLLTQENYSSMGIPQITLDSVDEDFNEDAYVQILTYNFLIL